MVEELKASTTEPALPTELVSPTAEVKKIEPAPAEQPLTAERVQQMIAEATAKALNDAKELGKRELQSQQDRNRAELARVQGRARQSESTLEAVRSHAKTLDPEVAKEFELAELRAKEQNRQGFEREEVVRQQQEQFNNTFIQNMTQYIQSLGIDPNDPRIEVNDPKDYFDWQSQVLTSVANIQKTNTQLAQSGLEQRLKTLEALVNQANIEVNSVGTELPGGAPAGSDADFVKKFASYDLPTTKENVDRYNRIINK